MKKEEDDISQQLLFRRNHTNAKRRCMSRRLDTISTMAMAIVGFYKPQSDALDSPADSEMGKKTCGLLDRKNNPIKSYISKGDV